MMIESYLEMDSYFNRIKSQSHYITRNTKMLNNQSRIYLIHWKTFGVEENNKKMKDRRNK